MTAPDLEMGFQQAIFRVLREGEWQLHSNAWTIMEAFARDLAKAGLVVATARRVAEMEGENNTLRGLVANSALDCVYCGLPAAEQNRCASGFPGCARADDQALAPSEQRKEVG